MILWVDVTSCRRRDSAGTAIATLEASKTTVFSSFGSHFDSFGSYLIVAMILWVNVGECNPMQEGGLSHHGERYARAF